MQRDFGCQFRDFSIIGTQRILATGEAVLKMIRDVFTLFCDCVTGLV